jgi:DNA-binding transcriptional LysR family regulator
MNLPALADFNLVAAHGGYTSASRASLRPKATLSRHVVELEQALGVRLIERAGRSFRLTDEGRALHSRTNGLLAEIDEIASEMTHARGQPRGKMRVSVPVTFGQVAMGRIAAEFLARFPEIELEVTVEDRVVDLIEEGYDAVIRVNPNPQSDLIGRCFYRDQLVIVAAPTIARPMPSSRGTSDDSTPAVVSVRANQLDTWIAIDEGSPISFTRRAVLRLPTPLMMREAALAGAGAAILGRDLVESDLAENRLVCWGTVPKGQVELWVLHTSRRLISSRVAAFFQFLCEQRNIMRYRQLPPN